MKLSIVTNAFNQARFIEETIDSVLSQGIEDLEYFVVDPGSKDGTGDVLARLQKKYPGKFILLQDKDSGPADGLNKAFAKATGDLFYYLNGDDLLEPGALKAAMAYFGAHPDCDCFYASGYLIDGEGKITRRVVSTRFSPEMLAYDSCCVLQQSTFYKAASFRKVGGFNVANSTSWDIEILLDMDLKGMKVCRTGGYWSKFRIYGESITGSQRFADKSRKQHMEYYQRVTGKTKKGTGFKIRRKIVRGLTKLLDPKVPLCRVVDLVKYH